MAVSDFLVAEIAAAFEVRVKLRQHGDRKTRTASPSSFCIRRARRPIVSELKTGRDTRFAREPDPSDWYTTTSRRGKS